MNAKPGVGFLVALGLYGRMFAAIGAFERLGHDALKVTP